MYNSHTSNLFCLSIYAVCLFLLSVMYDQILFLLIVMYDQILVVVKAI